MTHEQSRDSCILQHIDWREKHPERPVDEPQMAHQLGMDLEEFHARIEALKKARMSLPMATPDLMGEGK